MTQTTSNQTPNNTSKMTVHSDKSHRRVQSDITDYSSAVSSINENSKHAPSTSSRSPLKPFARLEPLENCPHKKMKLPPLKGGRRMRASTGSQLHCSLQRRPRHSDSVLHTSCHNSSAASAPKEAWLTKNTHHRACRNLLDLDEDTDEWENSPSPPSGSMSRPNHGAWSFRSYQSDGYARD